MENVVELKEDDFSFFLLDDEYVPLYAQMKELKARCKALTGEVLRLRAELKEVD